MRKRILIIAAIPLFMVFLLELILYSQSGRVKEKIEEYSGVYLDGEVQIRSVRLSIIKSFPGLSLWMRDPMIISGHDTLLNVSSAGIKISWWSLLSDNVQVRSVDIEDGYVNIYRNKAGKWNFNLLKEVEESKDKPGQGLSVAKANLRNIRLKLRDDREDLSAEFEIDRMVLAGSFRPESLRLSIENSMEIVNYSRNKQLILRQMPFRIRLAMERKEGGMNLEDIVIFLGNSELRGKGEWVDKEGEKRWAADLKGKKISVDQVLDLLGQDGKAFGKGEIDINLSGAGIFSEKTGLHYDLAFVLENGELNSGILRSGIKNISCSGSFVWDGKKETLIIKDLSADNRGEKISGTLKLTGFARPEVEASFTGKVPVGWITAFSGPYMTEGRGDVSFKNVKLKSSSGKNTFSGSGDIVFEKPDFKIMDSPFSAGDIELNLGGGEVKVKGSSIQFLGCSLNAEGSIAGIPAMIASRGFMDFDFTVTGTGLIIDDVLAQVKQFNSSLPAREEESQLKFRGRYRLGLDDIRYGDLMVDRANIEVRTSPSLITWKGEALSVNGEWRLDQSLHLWPSGGYTLRGSAECVHADVNKLFRQLNDFGQNFLTHEHISGSMECKAVMDITWNADNEVIPDKIQVCLGTRLSKGALQKFPMMENFASFVRIEDLRNIHFAELINIIEINNGRVFLPAMFIQSNAMNMDVSGEHTLDHEILYHIKVNAGQILTRRFQQHDVRLIPVKAETNGWFNLYYQISGTVDKFTYQTNKREVKTHFEMMNTKYKAGVMNLENKFGPVPWLRAPREWSEVQMFDLKSKGETVEFLDNF